jgi:mono/diheme cytochrome c family protein
MRKERSTGLFITENKFLMKQLTGAAVLMMALMSFQTAPKKQVPAKPAHTPVGTMKMVMNRGNAVYLQQCLACHQANGGGVPNLNAPLAGASAVKGNDKAKLIRIVLKGMTDRIEIDGEEYSNNMAPHPELTDQQIADVLTFVRNSWGNKASAVTPSEVKAVRAKTKQR